jgi:hypothetical protein
MLHTRTRLQYSLCICSAQGTGRPTGPQCSAVQCSAVSCCCVVVSSSQSVGDWELGLDGLVAKDVVIAAVVIVCPTLAADTVSASALSAQPAGSPASQPTSCRLSHLESSSAQRRSHHSPSSPTTAEHVEKAHGGVIAACRAVSSSISRQCIGACAAHLWRSSHMNK